MPIVSSLFRTSACQVLAAKNAIRCISTTRSTAKWGDRYVPPKADVDQNPPDYKEYPERDLVNFPRPLKYMYPPKVRLGVFPDSWFNFMYSKTGVTGPYLLGGGLLAFLLNKEFYVITPENNYVVCFIAAQIILNQLAGAKVCEYIYKTYNSYPDKLAENMKMKQDQVKSCVEESKDVVARCQAWSDSLFQAQKDQVAMMLEEEYRKRLSEYRQVVKRKMDYLVDLDETKKRYQRRHVVDWVVDQVRKSIDEKVQNAALAQCIAHLNTLSAKATI